MSAPDRGFLDHIVAHIDEDTPRLAYADWLDEHGRAERAEFVRVQVARARAPAWDPSQVRLRLREAELLRSHGEEWLAEVPRVEGARWEGFRRGVVAEVSFADFEALRAGAHACRLVAPVEAVTVRWPRRREGARPVAPIAELRELTLTGRPTGEDEVGWLADAEQLSTLRSLTARGLWVDGLRRLVASPHLARLQTFRAPSSNLGNAGVGVLTGAASLSALEELDLSGRGVTERYNEDPVVRSPGLETLARWPGLATVRRLDLSGNDLGRAGVRALIRSPHIGALRELSLRGCRLDGQAVGEFDGAPKGHRLAAVDLGENVLKDLGAEYAALVPVLRELEVLRLDRCEVSVAGARLFAKKAQSLGTLRVLDVGHNHFRAEGVAAVLARTPPVLHTLGLRDNDVHDDGAEVLAGSPAANGLLELDLGHNGIGRAGVEALAGAQGLRELLVLRLAGNTIDPATASALSASPLGRRLAHLEVDNTSPPPAPGPSGPDESFPF